MCKWSLNLRFIDNLITSNSNEINTIKKAHKMSVVYFKGGAVSLDLRFLVFITI